MFKNFQKNLFQIQILLNSTNAKKLITQLLDFFTFSFLVTVKDKMRRKLNRRG